MVDAVVGLLWKTLEDPDRLAELEKFTEYSAAACPQRHAAEERDCSESAWRRSRPFKRNGYVKRCGDDSRCPAAKYADACRDRLTSLVK